eukprot:1086648-Rhodomonas_salina.2
MSKAFLIPNPTTRIRSPGTRSTCHGSLSTRILIHWPRGRPRDRGRTPSHDPPVTPGRRRRRSHKRASSGASDCLGVSLRIRVSVRHELPRTRTVTRSRRKAAPGRQAQGIVALSDWLAQWHPMIRVTVTARPSLARWLRLRSRY